MELAGYIASLFVGISLGLIGGGGSILTVPVLVYLFAVSPQVAVSYSLFIVGLTSLVGAYNNYRKGLVNFKTALLFGSVSVTTVFIVRRFIVTSIPEVLFSRGNFILTYDLFVMIVFAILMVVASFAMIRRGSITPGSATVAGSLSLVLYGLLIGLVTGFLGAGGGFLLIPALVILLRLHMKEAVGTSLFIIALNSLIGFASEPGNGTVNWNLILPVSAIAIAGIFVGGYFNKKINGQKLKKGFGWFVLIMGVFIFLKETVFG